MSGEIIEVRQDMLTTLLRDWLSEKKYPFELKLEADEKVDCNYTTIGGFKLQTFSDTLPVEGLVIEIINERASSRLANSEYSNVLRDMMIRFKDYLGMESEEQSAQYMLECQGLIGKPEADRTPEEQEKVSKFTTFYLSNGDLSTKQSLASANAKISNDLARYMILTAWIRSRVVGMGGYLVEQVMRLPNSILNEIESHMTLELNKGELPEAAVEPTAEATEKTGKAPKVESSPKSTGKLLAVA